MNRLIYTTGNSFNNTGDLAMVEGYVYELEKRVPNLHVTLLGHEVDRLNRAFAEILSRGHSSAPSVSTVMTQFSGLGYLGHVGKAILKKQKPRMAFDACEKAVQGWNGKKGEMKAGTPEWKKFCDMIADAKAVVIGGGGYLNDIFVMSKPCYMTALIARKAGVPVYAVGQSVGPFTSNESMEIVRKLTELTNAFELREGNSMKWIQKLGAGEPKVHVGGDSALLAPIASEEEATEFLKNKFGGTLPKKIISLNPRYLHDANPEKTIEEHIALFTKTVQQLIDDLDVHIIATSTLFAAPGVTPKPHHDPQVGEAIKKGLKDPSRMEILSERLSVPQYKAVQARVNLCIAAGYHPSCLALAAGTPTLIMFTDEYNKMKNGGMAELFGVGKWITNPYDAKQMAELPAKAKEMMENEDSIRTGLVKRTAELTDIVLETLQKVADDLNHDPTTARKSA
jgi:polysaccharide pyruvyl transferase WcaK-like protein